MSNSSEQQVFTFARVDPETLQITLKYNTNGGTKWALDDLECVIPFDVLADQAVLIDDQITLQEDSAKVQIKIGQIWATLRAQRNILLAQSDWTQMPDSPLSQEAKSSWSEYRQKLRDFPEEVTVTSLQDFDSLTWPVKPDPSYH